MNSGSRDTRTPRRGLDATLHPDAFQDRGIKQSLRIWEQGHILAGVPVFWVAPEGHDQVTNSIAAEDDEGVDRPGRVISAEPTLCVTVWDEVDAAVDPDDVGARPAMSDEGWAIVTSQTCDIQATGPGERHTHVQVSPVVRLDGQISAERLKAARAGMVRELVHLADFDEDGDWFADLRISLPVSKGVLLGRTPRAAFATTDMANKFSERVAAKIRRPALHDAVDDPLRKSLREAIRKAVDHGQHDQQPLVTAHPMGSVAERHVEDEEDGGRYTVVNQSTQCPGVPRRVATRHRHLEPLPIRLLGGRRLLPQA